MKNSEQELLPFESEEHEEREEREEDEMANARRQWICRIDNLSSRLIKLLLIVSLFGVIIQVSMHIPLVRNWLSLVERLEGVRYK
ncbi:hypothetical protein NQ117_04800 [Paenibacillus sp. SC116]|uniref:hypothetical protein n=1 Tax=Paenibacillus sp. SC116 TaxID=2968986 RepID=UPI00215AE646|nr:hypothetical protein [Paenibacillus sp. SC116]MCR8842991.1 hypothetical protein [Paenibacillus sp. SC116]